MTSPFTDRKAGEAFLVAPPGGGKGPGVLVLHSWWGLTPWVQDFCRKVAEAGYTVLAPDLLDGVQPITAEEGEAVLAGVDPDELSGLVMSSAHALRAASADANQPIAVIGFSMGGSLALWLSARLTREVGAVVSFYGTQSIDFDDATAIYQGHFGADDHMVSEEDRVVTESILRIGGRETDFHLYPESGHWFFEEGDHAGGKAHSPKASELAWHRVTTFLAETVGSSSNAAVAEDDTDDSQHGTEGDG